MKWQHCSGSLSQYVFHHFCLNQQFVFFNISQLNCVCSCVYFLHMCYNDTPSVKQCKKTTIKNVTLSFPLLQNVERSVSPHGEIRVFATVPCGLPACCEGEVAAVRGGDDQSPGGTSRRNHQTPPTTGPQTRHTKHKHTRWQTKSKSIILMFTLQLKRIQCSLEKRKNEPAPDPNDQSCVQFLESHNDTTNAVLFYVVLLVHFVLAFVSLLLLQRITALTGKPITWEKVQVPKETVRHCRPEPPTTHRAPISRLAQDGL